MPPGGIGLSTKKGLDAYCVRFQANELKGEKLVQSVLCISRLVQQIGLKCTEYKEKEKKTF